MHSPQWSVCGFSARNHAATDSWSVWVLARSLGNSASSMSSKREEKGPCAILPPDYAFPSSGGHGQAEDRDAERSHHRDAGEGGRVICALEMEITNRGMHGDSKLDCVNCDGLISRNCGDSAEVSVPLSLPGKRTTHMEGDDLYRLRERKFLIEDRKRLCALALSTALLGILLMIIHAEICYNFYEAVSLTNQPQSPDFRTTGLFNTENVMRHLTIWLYLYLEHSHSHPCFLSALNMCFYFSCDFFFFLHIRRMQMIKCLRKRSPLCDSSIFFS